MALGYVTRLGGVLHFEYVIPYAEVKLYSPGASGVCVRNMASIDHKRLASTPILKSLIDKDLAYIKRTRGESALAEALYWPVCINGAKPENRGIPMALSAESRRAVGTMIHERLHAFVRRMDVLTEKFRVESVTDKKHGFTTEDEIMSGTVLRRELEKYYPKSVVKRMISIAVEKGWAEEVVTARVKGRKDYTFAVEELYARIATIQYLLEVGNASKQKDPDFWMSMRRAAQREAAYLAGLSMSREDRFLAGVFSKSGNIITAPTEEQAFVERFFLHVVQPADRGYKPLPAATAMVLAAYAPYLDERSKALAARPPPSFKKGDTVVSSMPDFIVNQITKNGTKYMKGVFLGTAVIQDVRLAASGIDWIYIYKRQVDGVVEGSQGSSIVKPDT